VIIRGTEGMALQASSCCSPIPGDAIVGHMRKDQGLAVHQYDCPVAAAAGAPIRAVDRPAMGGGRIGPFGAKLAVSAANERGTLARIAVAIAEAESNILNVGMEDENASSAAELQAAGSRPPPPRRVMRMLRGCRRSRACAHQAREKGGGE